MGDGSSGSKAGEVGVQALVFLPRFSLNSSFTTKLLWGTHLFSNWKNFTRGLVFLQPSCPNVKNCKAKACRWHTSTVVSWLFFQGENEKLVNLTAKTHFVMHSLYNARWAHPSLVWCSKGEDMQRVAKLWKSCHDGCKQWQVAKRASWKERHLLAMRSKVG